jgi:exopolysaccharide biosynthesis polyprenyl glycosylphosphotransferase
MLNSQYIGQAASARQKGVQSPAVKKLELLFGLLRIPFDALAVASALALAYWLRVHNMDLIPQVQLLEPAVTLPDIRFYAHGFILPGILIFILTALSLKLYAFQVTKSAWREVGRSILATAVWLVVVMAWYFLIRKELFYSRILLLHSTFFLGVFVIFARAFLTILYRWLLKRGYGVRWVVSVGTHALPDTVEDTLIHDHCYRYIGHMKNLSDLRRQQGRLPLDLVLQTDPDPDSGDTTELIEFCRSEHIGYAFLPPVLADVPHMLRVERIGLLPMMRFQPTPLDGWGRVIKRGFDLVLGLAFLIVALPLFAVITLAILLESGWPIFYVSRRIGDFGRTTVPVLKFRSMVKDADVRKKELLAMNHRQGGPLFKVKDDPRVTRVGKLLRRLSWDELPQLFNVVAGHMSLVGPRPHLPEEVKLYTPYQKRVFAVRPGLTGLAQVSGRSDLSFEEEVHLDLQYIEEWSAFLDFWILWRTAVVVLSRRGAD